MNLTTSSQQSRAAPIGPSARPIGLRVLLLGVILSMSVAGCSRALPTYRYRMTVDVQTPEGVKHGSSVIEIRNVDKGRGFPGPEAGGIDQTVVGEAVPISLPHGATIYALLTRPGDEQYAARLMTRLHSDLSRSRPFDEFLRQLPTRRAETNLPRLIDPVAPDRGPQPFWPMFVTFVDNRRPGTVREIDPTGFSLPDGEKVFVRNITVQMTDDRPAFQISRFLPWVDDPKYGYLSGREISLEQSNVLADKLSLSAFKRTR